VGNKIDKEPALAASWPFTAGEKGPAGRQGHRVAKTGTERKLCLAKFHWRSERGLSSTAVGIRRPWRRLGSFALLGSMLRDGNSRLLPEKTRLWSKNVGASEWLHQGAGMDPEDVFAEFLPWRAHLRRKITQRKPRLRNLKRI